MGQFAIGNKERIARALGEVVQLPAAKFAQTDFLGIRAEGTKTDLTTRTYKSLPELLVVPPKGYLHVKK